jgi:mono/diheme cytochrome c family protein
MPAPKYIDRCRHILLLLWFAAIFSANAASLQAQQARVDFRGEIRPILSRCIACHGPATQENGLRLDNAKDSKKLKAVVAGRPDDSGVLKRVTSSDPDLRMPPPDSGPALTPKEVALLKNWIATGAEYASHWAFEPIARPEVPKISGPAVKNSIDGFIVQKMADAGLKISPEADRATLLRRVSLDLTGLPPTPAEVRAFLADTRPDAYERQVRRLLASPHYGERQARHWLDLARYADSNGYTVDGPRSIWPWRDWVITALNQDLPFDRFTIDQLAGDLIPNAAREQILATGFHRNTSFNEEGGTDPEQFRVERTIDRTNTTGTVWLGLTVGCAQCHDHKYDPISQRDYYQLYAYFNNADEPKISVTSSAVQGEVKKLRARLAEIEKKTPPPKHKALPTTDEINYFRIVGRNAYKEATIVKAEAQRAKLAISAADQSVLASGPNPSGDTYQVKLKTPLPRITAIRLETLTDPLLPKNGPGRASNGNFILSSIRLKYNGQEIAFSAADADLEQENYPASEAINRKTKNGWAINPGNRGKLNEPRSAVFRLARELNLPAGAELDLELQFPEKPATYTIGKFKVSITDAADEFLNLPVMAQRIITSTIAPLDDSQKQAVVDLIDLKSKKIDPAAAALRDQIRQMEETVTSLAMGPAVKPRKTQIFQRGDFLQPGAEVSAMPLEAAGNRLSDVSSQSRLDLARWLVDPENPLTSRVTVNREWQKFFGLGLVETENDFGVQGALPTHPELLDYLARYFSGNGWSFKGLHYLIVTSAAYRQASGHRADLAAKDPQNKLLGRQNRLRLDAEIIRDNALAVSGRITQKLGGPPVFPPQPAELFAFTQSQRGWKPSEGEDRYRRGLYTWIWRQSKHPLFTTFDAADAQTACTRRGRSNTPLQALHLANDPVFVELANAWGQRVRAEVATANDEERIEQMFLEGLGRMPTVAEIKVIGGLLAAERKAGRDDAGAWTTLARLLMNTDEFITRE